MPMMSYMAVQLIVNGYYYSEEVKREDLEKISVPGDDGDDAEALVQVLYGPQLYYW